MIKITIDLDSILMILGNPTRRRIIRVLSCEPSYPHKIAKILGLGQQLIAKHLNRMEEAGIVTSTLKKSPYGPKRRTYMLKENIAVTVNVASHLFNVKTEKFDKPPEIEEFPEEEAILMKKIDETKEIDDEGMRMEKLMNLITEIDEKIMKVEKNRIILLYIRNYAMHEVSKIIQMFEDPTIRMILHCLIDRHEINIREISTSLNIRESLVKEILTKLKREFEYKWVEEEG